ncbi:hypothetical protein E6C76_07085 [Pseudothauera nasutitermitis]|uniref:Abortive phage infection protein C-terminal domain-containing protein n=1 Tax=Pseudothauera nasutitermitis TaxID=2565930 RepID=A0A4S4B331_9RHOO|nr:AIPR family protein [Pseudothauera nasutitermitis]THF66585.1 hypothetical protein E6C76_07085 [Pseudothauera nasutitermitis]
MEHRILQSYVDEFCISSQIDKLPLHKRFEYFTNYTIVSQIHPEAFSEVANLAEVDVDTSGTFGIDAIVVIVNNNIVRSESDIDLLAKSNNIDAKIIFIQSKTSKNIDSGDVLKFMEATKIFLTSPRDGERDESLQQPYELLSHLFSTKIARLHSSNSPECLMAYSYAGSQAPDDFPVTLAEQRCAELRSTIQDFKRFSFEFWNAELLIDTFKQVENQFEIEIRFKNNLPLDSISDVDQAYIGYIDAPEFLKLIVDPNGSIRRNVFFDNVRDFQGSDNSVNTEIAEAIKDIGSVDKFVLYNNGITAVASFMKNLGANRFLLRNYQIVNGCQTSNVLYLNRSSSSLEKISVPIKIVHTNDADVVGRIIRANNRQTPVPNEAFVALEKWHKRLQEYVSIESRRIGENLFYERRSREYSLLDQAPEKKRIIGLHGMIRAYTGAFLQRPHMVIANNPTEILRTRGDHLFGEKHQFGPYLASAMLIYKIQDHLNKVASNSFLQKHRYHVAMLLVAGKNGHMTLPDPKSNKANILSEHILVFCMDNSRFIETLRIAVEFTKSIHDEFVKTRGYTPRNPPLRSGEFSDYLLQKFGNA